MPREPVRFIHAARLSLDHQLQGLCALPEEWHETVRDATLTAFQRVVDACLEHRVHFLLLTGDSFDARDRSLRAQAMLAKGLNRLAEQGIPTYVCAGALDPWETWLPQIRLPASAHTLGEASSNALVTVRRNNQAIATIRWLSREELESITPTLASQPECSIQESNRSGSQSPFSIGVSTFDAKETSSTDCPSQPSCREIINRPGFEYWGLGGAGEAGTTSNGVLTIHRPGPTQGISSADSGICGCSLVEVPAEGHLKITRLPTAPVHWMSLRVQVSEGMAQSDVLAAMRIAYERHEPISGEKLRLASWEFKSDASLPACLVDEAARDQIIELWHHELDLRAVSHNKTPVHTVSIRCQGSSKSDTAGRSDSRMRHDYRDRLESRLADPHWSPARCLAKSALRGGPWQSAMQSIVDTLDHEDLSHESRSRADKWFGDAEELPT